MRKLFQGLQTNKTSEKVRVLVEYFQTASNPDKVWLIALFTGRRPRSIVKLALLRQWAATYTQIPDWLFEESYSIVGDLAETIALLMEHENTTEEFTLDYWMQELKRAKLMSIEEQQLWVYEAWNRLGREDRFLFNKLLTGGFRVGVSEALLVQALSQYTGIEKAELFHRLSGKWDPYNTEFQYFLTKVTGESTSKPYPYYLAYPLENVEDLGELNNWQIENKWDGIRGQLIQRKGEITLWSRGEEIINGSFPEIIRAVGLSCFEGVLDGEILAWNHLKAEPNDFSMLQKRLGRKNPSKKMLQENPVVFKIYDILEYQGKDLRSLVLSERHEKLLEIFHESLNLDTRSKQKSNHADLGFILLNNEGSKSNLNEEIQRIEIGIPETALFLSEPVILASWEAISQYRLEAKLRKVEGLMLKRKDSFYGIGRKRGDWWKWKMDAETIDAVMVYAQKGHGKRASLYTDFTFAIWKGDELVPFAKAYSGLTKKEIEEINVWIKEHTRERFGPVCGVHAELVFEIAFEGINKSPRHKSGIAVRFPRIVRWRKDKSIKDIARVEDLL